MRNSADAHIRPIPNSYMSALEAYVSKRQKQKAEKIAVKVFQYSKCCTLKCF